MPHHRAQLHSNAECSGNSSCGAVTERYQAHVEQQQGGTPLSFASAPDRNKNNLPRSEWKDSVEMSNVAAMRRAPQSADRGAASPVCCGASRRQSFMSGTGQAPSLSYYYRRQTYKARNRLTRGGKPFGAAMPAASVFFCMFVCVWHVLVFHLQSSLQWCLTVWTLSDTSVSEVSCTGCRSGYKTGFVPTRGRRAAQKSMRSV